MTENSWYDQTVIELKAAWAIAKKDMRIYYIKPNIIVSGIMFPLFMFLAFSVSRGTRRMAWSLADRARPAAWACAAPAACCIAGLSAALRASFFNCS